MYFPEFRTGIHYPLLSPAGVGTCEENTGKGLNLIKRRCFYLILL